MKTWQIIFAAACAVSAPVFADDEVSEEPEAAADFRVTSDAVAINLHTDDAALHFSSVELAAKQVTYRAGETVTLTAPDGTTATVVADAAAAGGVTLAVGAGGLSSDCLWRLDNSNGSVAFVGVAWETFDAAWRKAGDGLTTALDTLAEGPDRKLKKSEVPPVAYSGDDWAGDLSKAATVRFTSPGGSTITWNRTGTDAETFTFNERGTWKVELWYEGSDASGDPDATALIDIQTAGFVLVIK